MNLTRSAAFVAAFAAAAPATPDSLPAYERKLGTFEVTYYWVIDEASVRYSPQKNAELRDRHGNVIAKTSKRFKRDLAMEGTGWLRRSDRRTVTYDREVDGESRFRITNARYGNGIGSCELEPYRTVAVDPRVIKLGSKLFIPELKGTRLPDGTIHDGIFIANDRGAFRGRTIDVFTRVGSSAARPFTSKAKSRSKVTVYLVAGPDPNGCHRR